MTQEIYYKCTHCDGFFKKKSKAIACGRRDLESVGESGYPTVIRYIGHLERYKANYQYFLRRKD